MAVGRPADDVESNARFGGVFLIQYGRIDRAGEGGVRGA